MSTENKPFRLLHHGEYATYTEARKRENYLKTSSGRKWLDKIERAASSVG